MLAHFGLLQARHGLAEGSVEAGEHLGAVAERVHRPRSDQRLAGTLVQRPRVDPLEEAEEAVEGVAVGARLQDRLNRRAAHAPHRAQTEADRAVPDDGEFPAALVHVGWQDDQAVVQRGQVTPDFAALADVLHDIVGLVEHRRQQRGHEIGRIVALQPCGLVGEQRIGGRVRFVETVAAEGLDLLGQLRGCAGFEALGDDPLPEVAQLRLDERRVLLAHRLAKYVGVTERVAGQVVGDQDHLLLVDDDPVGGLEDVLQPWRRIGHLLPAEFALDVPVGHARVQRPGTDQRVRGDQVVEAVAAHRPQLVEREAGLELEDTRRAAARQHLVDAGVVEGDIVHGVRLEDRAGLRVAELAEARLDRPHRVVDDGERLEPQEVHLEHPGVLETVHVVLGDDVRPVVGASPGPTPASVPASLGLRADRHVVVERPRRNHDARRVHGRVARQPLERDRVVEEALVAVIGFVERLDLTDPLHRLLDGVALPRLVGDHLRDPVGLADIEAKNAAHVPDDRAALHRPEGHDLADGVAAVLLAHVLDHFTPALVAEIDVDVRHRDPLGVEEALEDEAVADRIEVGDPQRVGHE